MSTYIIHGRFTLSYNFTFSFFFLNGFFILWDSLVNGEWTWLWKWERVCVYVLYTRHCLPLDASFEKLVTLSLSSPLVSVLPIRIQNRVLSLSFPLNNQTRRDSPHSPLLPRATCRVLLPDVSSRVYDRTIWDAERNGRARRVMSCWIEILLDLFAKAFSKEKKRE